MLFPVFVDFTAKASFQSPPLVVYSQKQPPVRMQRQLLFNMTPLRALQQVHIMEVIL